MATETLKNMAIAAALVALRKKYNRPAPELKKDDSDAETGRLIERIIRLNEGTENVDNYENRRKGGEEHRRCGSLGGNQEEIRQTSTRTEAG